MRLEGYVHRGTKYNNAFWDGQEMVFGDGDGRVFTDFTGSLDVIGHELTHGVTEFTAGLEYHNQSGALNESLSDVFGSLVKQWKLGQTADQADWLVGVEVFTPMIEADALRSLKEPGTAYDNALLGKDPQPGHMSDYVELPDTDDGDNGGVHVNSGIPNKAFYLTAVGIGGRHGRRPVTSGTSRCGLRPPPPTSSSSRTPPTSKPRSCTVWAEPNSRRWQTHGARWASPSVSGPWLQQPGCRPATPRLRRSPSRWPRCRRGSTGS